MSILVNKVKEQINDIIINSAKKSIADGLLENAELTSFTVEVPSNREHGD